MVCCSNAGRGYLQRKSFNARWLKRPVYCIPRLLPPIDRVGRVAGDIEVLLRRLDIRSEWAFGSNSGGAGYDLLARHGEQTDGVYYCRRDGVQATGKTSSAEIQIVRPITHHSAYVAAINGEDNALHPVLDRRYRGRGSQDSGGIRHLS